MNIDIRLGRWQDALRNVDACDSLICDPPYSERTVRGQRSSSSSSIAYEAWRRWQVDELLHHWLPITRSWAVVFGDHVMMRWIEDVATEHGWHFNQRVWLKTDGAPCFNGLAPDHDVEHVAIMRPRRKVLARHRGGSWHGPTATETPGFVGSKPLWLMRSVVVRYSEPGDLVVDPCAGTGTTAVACHVEGRAFVGAELNPVTLLSAMARIDGTTSQSDMFALVDVQGEKPAA